MTEPTPNTSHAQQARRLLLRHVLKVLPEVVKDVSTLLDKLPEPGDSSDKVQFTETLRRSWLTLALPWQRAAGQRLLGQAAGATSGSHLSTELRLLDEEDVELQILAGRLAQTLAAPAQDEFNDLRLRLQHLEQSEELAGNDAVQPVHLAQATLGAWSEVGLTRDDWQHCKPVIEPRLASAYNEACHLTNAWLLQQGVLPHIDLRALVRRGRDSGAQHPPENAAPSTRNGAATTWAGYTWPSRRRRSISPRQICPPCSCASTSR